MQIESSLIQLSQILIPSIGHQKSEMYTGIRLINEIIIITSS